MRLKLECPVTLFIFLRKARFNVLKFTDLIQILTKIVIQVRFNRQILIMLQWEESASPNTPIFMQTMELNIAHLRLQVFALTRIELCWELENT